jgi:type IV pilus assembly protein PilB
MATATLPSKLGGLARMLVQDKLLSEDEAIAIQASATAQQLPFISQLVSSKKLPALKVAETASNAFGFPLFDLNALNADYLPPKGIEAKLMQSSRVMALQSRGNTLFVAISDPTNLHALDDVQFQAGMTLSPVVVEDDKLSKWIDKIAEASSNSLQSIAVDDDFNLDMEGEAPDQEEAQTLEIDDAPVVKYLQKILMDAINMGASDLHFEPYEKFYRIRYRVDGVLREIAQPPLAIKEKLASRIKIISNLDISEKRVPQDGKMKLVLSKTRTIDFRVSTLPLVNGEKIVMRILDPASAKLGIEALATSRSRKKHCLPQSAGLMGWFLLPGPLVQAKQFRSIPALIS